MARRFVAETNLPYTFDEELTRETFWAGINSDAILLVDDHDGVIAGAVMGCLERDFCVEYSAYLTKLYVEKEFRGLAVSRNLLKAFLKETEDAAIVFTSATAGMGERVEKLYVRLFERYGFHILGRIMFKENL